MPDLVIVESPAKAKTIEKYLGKGYRVKATMGHLRDLPKHGLGVDVKAGFQIDYQPIEGKEDMIAELGKAAAKSEKVFLATDPDREGEAISWHLKELLGLPDQKAQRVTFNEITAKVVTESILHPRAIDTQLVDAQQARRVLDRLVGYQLSPLLWRKIRKGLSAGRVQSVATRIVVDREEEIRAFVASEYWTIDVKLDRVQEPGQFTARYFAPEGEKKAELPHEEAVNAILNAVREAPFTVRSVKRGEKKRNPAPPFITSTLQQEASRRHGMSARKTMMLAQQLYEGVEITGHGLTGLITYMRTDSLRLSEEAVQQARQLIKTKYGNEYCPAAVRVYKSKGGAQDAHEAIRPSDVTLTPEKLQRDLTADQYKLYRLIWARFVACQMAQAVYDTLTIDVSSAGHVFRANHTSVKFSGFTAVYEESRDEESEAPGARLPQLGEGEALRLADTDAQQHFTQPPPRYTEATLIKALEEQGIGRPSTYAPTVAVITDREYVAKEGKQLRPTPLGEVVTGFMRGKFEDIVDVAFTARMESELDEVEEGKKEWKTMLESFYRDFEAALQKAEADPERIRIPDEQTEIVCDQCGRNMVIKVGRFGRFLACPGYPECKNTKPLAEEMPGSCPLCAAKILKKKSRNGYTYYGCEKNPSCGFMTWDVPQKENCPVCGRTLFKKSARGAKKTFCINADCSQFVPEEERGYQKKAASTAEGGTDPKKTPAKGRKAASGAAKSAATAKKGRTASAARKPAAKNAKKTTKKKSAAQNG